MSKIISPAGWTDNRPIPSSASWWRMRLAPRPSDGVFYTTEVIDTPISGLQATVMEFFDGENASIDAFRQPLQVKLTDQVDYDNKDIISWGAPSMSLRVAERRTIYLEVLYTGPPTPSPLWTRLTTPGSQLPELQFPSLYPGSRGISPPEPPAMWEIRLDDPFRIRSDYISRQAQLDENTRKLAELLKSVGIPFVTEEDLGLPSRKKAKPKKDEPKPTRLSHIDFEDTEVDTQAVKGRTMDIEFDTEEGS